MTTPKDHIGPTQTLTEAESYAPFKESFSIQIFLEDRTITLPRSSILINPTT